MFFFIHCQSMCRPMISCGALVMPVLPPCPAFGAGACVPAEVQAHSMTPNPAALRATACFGRFDLIVLSYANVPQPR